MRAAIARYGMFAPGQNVGVAVSGGADSVCLLDVLGDLAAEWALKLSVLHLNHRLRGEESRADEEFVRALASNRGYPFHCRAVDVAIVAADTGDNLEQAARRMRREYFLEFVRRGELDRVALGHTSSDQAETVLFRFLRGSGTAGLSGIRPVTEDGFVRPLLCVERSEVLEYLQGRGLAWREDSSNQDLRFARNRVRHALLPALTREWNPELPRTLAETAEISLDEELFWSRRIQRLVSRRLKRAGPALLVRSDWLGSLEPAIARRAVREIVRQAKGDLRQFERKHVELFRDLARSAAGSGRVQLPGLDVFRSFDWIRVAPRVAAVSDSRDWELRLAVPGEITLPFREAVLRLEVMEKDKLASTAASGADCRYNSREHGSDLDWGRISGVLCARNWRPGDQYRPVGQSLKIKVKTLFQNARIPLWDRRGWPVITLGDEIVWVAGFGPAAEYAAKPESRSTLIVRALGYSTEN